GVAQSLYKHPFVLVYSWWIGEGNTKMARAIATSTDINAKLARGECANYQKNCCLGRTPCLIIQGEPCGYFATYVKPLLETPDIAARYHREAKISVALNPKSKVIRKRRQAAEPKLPEISVKITAKPPVVPVVAVAPPSVVPSGPVIVTVPTPRPAPVVREEPLLLLEITPDQPRSHARGRR
ncbi:MAG: hypothetical protein WCJ56_16220, partial [bacterium]